MLMNVGEFRLKVESDLPKLVECLQEETGRYGTPEQQAWTASLPVLASSLASKDLEPLHINIAVNKSLSLEYRLPASSSWCDAVLLGRTNDRPAVMAIELKDWEVSGDRPGPRENLIEHNGALCLHPSDQVQGYAEYFRRFHSAVLENRADVHGCVLFTRARTAAPYALEPHRRLVERYPIFCRSSIPSATDPSALADFVHQRIPLPDPDFARSFEAGRYIQDRNFIRQTANRIRSSESSYFVLLDEQRRGFELCLHHVHAAVRAGKEQNEKRVIVIEGPPGSGKSALAVQLWAALAADDSIDGSVVFTTTSGCQRSNWEELFREAAGGHAGRGIVKPTNTYNPGLTPLWVNEQRALGESMLIRDWKQNLEIFSRQRASRTPDDSYAVSIVDEAHAMIDPTPPNPEGGPHSGWCRQAGPQGWHIMRCSRVSVFLMDTEQSYRDNETTTRAAMERWAAEHGVSKLDVISLNDAQFRCGGSKEYLDWLESLLSTNQQVPTAKTTWRRTNGHITGKFTFDVVDSPLDLDRALRPRIAEGYTARLGASYARPWLTKKLIHPHTVAPHEMDFNLECQREGKRVFWSRIWNHAPDEDYTNFIQAPAGTPMGSDPLCEVGCPYVLRGFDYDYLGILWLKDLLWRGNAWDVDVQNVHETAWQQTRAAAAKRSATAEAKSKLIRRLLRGYRILFSRAIRGIYVWIEDDETRDHVLRRLNS